MMDKWKNQIDEIINNVETNILDIYFQLVSECLKGALDPEQRFQYILEAVQEKTFSKETDSLYISEFIINTYTEQYIKELVEYIRMLSERNYSVEEFYNILYRHVFIGEFYPKETAIQSFLLFLLAERTPGIPYYQTKDLLKLPDEEYKQIIDKIHPQIRKAIAMLNRHFNSKTEEASQLYYISKELASEEDRIVFWSAVMSIMKAISKDRMKRREEDE